MDYCFLATAVATSGLRSGSHGETSTIQQPLQEVVDRTSTAPLPGGDVNPPDAPAEVVPDCAKDILAKLEPGLVRGHLVSTIMFAGANKSNINFS